ncbi:MAG: ATP-dependent helicase [Elusimicrobia bacterium]|nr:ATP-dependent helicase [Elusimicrobiota bacterium]
MTKATNLPDGKIITKGVVVATAGAGTGKTTFLTRQFVEKVRFLIREGYSVKDAVKSILAVTFTIKATEEMKNRIAAALSAPDVLPYFQIFTIDSFCRKVLRKFCLRAEMDSEFSMMSEGYEKIFFKHIFASVKDRYPLKEIDPVAGDEKKIYKILEKFRYMKISPADVLKMECSLGEDFLVFLKTVYEVFVAELKKNAVLDFPQLLFETLKLLANRDIAAAIRREYRFVFIDEFQDTSPLQAEIFRKISPEFLCVVGDFNQSIYSFRGAAPENIYEIAEKADYLKKLDVNRRSSKKILSFVNAFMRKVSRFQPLAPAPGAPAGVNVKIVLCDGRISQARYIADKIESLKREKNLKYGDFAIVLRSLKTAVSDFEAVLRHRGIPFITTAGGGFYDRPEIKQILALVKAVATPTDDIAFLDFLSSPMIAFSPQEIYEISREKGASLFEKFLAYKPEKNVKKDRVIFIIDKFGWMKEHSVYREILAIVAKCGFASWINENFQSPHRERAFANLKKFLELAAKYEGDVPSPSLSGFVKYQTSVQMQGIVESEATLNPGDCVEIFTVHKIKGLERRVVFVANITKSQFPASSRRDLPWDVTANGIYDLPKKKTNVKSEVSAEEWRLFYVACTRAKENLFLLGSFSKKDKISPILDIFVKDSAKLNPEFSNVAELETNFGGRSASVASSKASVIPVFSDFETSPVFSEKSVVEWKLKNGFTVTEISHYDFCPRKYFYGEILKVPTASSRSFAEAGNVFHQAIEFFGELGGRENFRKRVLSALSGLSLRRVEAEKMISNFLRSPFTKNPFAKEVIFNLKFGEFLIKGTIDRIEKVSSGFEIYDYKTNKVPDVAPYEFTMNVYALGCGKVLGFSPVKKLGLFFLFSGKVSDVKIMPESQTEKRLRKILDGIKNFDFARVPSVKCGICPYKRICEKEEK